MEVPSDPVMQAWVRDRYYQKTTDALAAEFRGKVRQCVTTEGHGALEDFPDKGKVTITHTASGATTKLVMGTANRNHGAWLRVLLLVAQDKFECPFCTCTRDHTKIKRHLQKAQCAGSRGAVRAQKAAAAAAAVAALVAAAAAPVAAAAAPAAAFEFPFLDSVDFDDLTLEGGGLQGGGGGSDLLGLLPVARPRENDPAFTALRLNLAYNLYLRYPDIQNAIQEAIQATLLQRGITARVVSSAAGSVLL